MESFLSGKLVDLRPFRMEDAAHLAMVANNPKIARNMRDMFPSPYSVEDAYGFINRISVSDTPNFVFAIVVDGKAIGSIGVYRNTDVYRFSGEIGYWIGEPYWGKGIITEAIGLICDFVFKATDLVRIYAEVFDWNPASKNALIKNGFQVEGVHKRSVFKHGSFCDSIYLAKVKAE